MKTGRKVLSAKNKPMHIPVIGGMVWYLFLDHFHAPEWAWTLVITGWSLVTLIAIADISTRQETEL
jgi:hypothetical protein